MADSRTGPRLGHPTFNRNISICSRFTQRTSESYLNHSREPCEWVDADLGVQWVKAEQILHVKVGCPNFGPVWGSAFYPHYFNMKLTPFWNWLPCNMIHTIPLQHDTTWNLPIWDGSFVALLTHLFNSPLRFPCSMPRWREGYWERNCV